MHTQPMREYFCRHILPLFVVITLIASVWNVPDVQSRRLAEDRNGEAQHISGVARIIDGDTLDVGGTRVRLQGIDAPEIGQFCETMDGQQWDAGRRSAQRLRQLVGEQAILCHRIKLGKYGRVIGDCVAGKINLSAQMVLDGAAWAFVKYSSDYALHETTAQRKKRGIWALTCQKAWNYRTRRWAQHAPNAPEGCAIKGNISSRGKVYHMPWSPWYARTKITPSRGERWFCDEKEAEDAGWRPAVVN